MESSESIGRLVDVVDLVRSFFAQQAAAGSDARREWFRSRRRQQSRNRKIASVKISSSND